MCVDYRIQKTKTMLTCEKTFAPTKELWKEVKALNCSLYRPNVKKKRQVRAYNTPKNDTNKGQKNKMEPNKTASKYIQLDTTRETKCHTRARKHTESNQLPFLFLQVSLHKSVRRLNSVKQQLRPVARRCILISTVKGV